MATTTNNGWTTPDDSDPFKNGASAIRTLGSAIDTSTGKGLIAWQSYTPTLSGITIGNGTLDFKYCQIGKTVHVKGQITLGSTSSVTTTLDIGVPVNHTGYTLGYTLGNVSFTNNTVYNQGMMVSVANAASFRAVVGNASGTYVGITDLSATVPFTWGNTHKIFVTFTYQAA